MGLSALKQVVLKRSFRDAPLPKRPDESDVFVDTWKRAWLAGANAYWATKCLENPNADDPARAAWQAGSEWAKAHPDRRQKHHLRLAHPNRRATDAGRCLPRAVKIGACGLGLMAVRWALQTLRPRKEVATLDVLADGAEAAVD
jgi:hypothetical protein